MPAYKGGFIRGYDLICRNNSSRKIDLFGKSIDANHVLTIQVKVHLRNADIIPDCNIDFYFCVESDVHLNNISDKNIITAKDMAKEIFENKLFKDTKEWLLQSLSWAECK